MLPNDAPKFLDAGYSNGGGMRLTQFKVTKYRNVIESGWIYVNDITAFVGPNEAGKSNLFEALYRINPFVPNEAYNIDEDWPVDDWGNKNESAVVCEANFALDEAEIKELYAQAAIHPSPEQLHKRGRLLLNRLLRELPSELSLTRLSVLQSRTDFFSDGRPYH